MALALLGAFLAAALLAGPRPAAAEDPPPSPARERVEVTTDASGSRLRVDGRDFLVRGMNWDYIPIGQNYSFDLWQQPEAVITAALDHEMSLLAGMGVNAIRVNTGIPPRWVRYLRDRYGIYSIVNHTVGRYGFTVDGVWTPNIDYASPGARAAIAADVAAMVQTYRDVPGVLMYLLGNENNYGLSWTSFEIEALPQGERDRARARHLYSMFGEIARATKQQDPGVPVAISNGDVQYLDVIAEECRDVDVFGTNVYRGISARDLFQVVREKLGRPVLFTEFGSDAFNARELREDQAMQARYLIGQWREIYEQSSGHGREGNAIGGCIFQWSDGWWKLGQTTRLDVHDVNASWPNGGYVEDFVEGENNMNEEWWGICAKGYPDSRGLYELYPRAAYYALRRVFALDPYAPGVTDDAIRSHFAAITPTLSTLEARGDRASLLTNAFERVRLSALRLQFETYSTGGELVSTPESPAVASTMPAFRGFDQLQSFYAEVQANPSPSVTGRLAVNVVGNVPRNPIDQIFYENRAVTRTVQTTSGPVATNGIERVKIYQASMSWDERWFLLDAFYRTGHYHWGYEGDFFGLYREANYGANIDIYNADAPAGFEMTGKRALTGLKLAFGPQLWWGANSAVLLKYRRPIGAVDATAIYQNEFSRQQGFATSSAISLRPTRKATLHLKTVRGPFTIEAGGIWSGANHVDEPFQVIAHRGDTVAILRDRIQEEDAFGGKLFVGVQKGRVQAYAQTASMGLVADAGPTATITYTAWNLKDTGSGNQRNVIGGLAVSVGAFQMGPNFLWQKPIVGPMPADAPSPGRLRNILVDPFAVRANREMTAAEFLISYDPTPATWMWAWDNDLREESRFSGSLGFVWKHLPTSMDAAIGILEDGVTPFAFERSTPPRDLWELQGRAVSRLGPDWRIVAHAFVGTGEPNADDPRLVERYGADVRVAGSRAVLSAYAKFDDWGPYDYHRDFNLTFPVQLMGDLSYTLGTPLWFDNPQTRVGVRSTWRSLDLHSPRYTGLTGDPNGNEWEIRTYVRLAM